MNRICESANRKLRWTLAIVVGLILGLPATNLQARSYRSGRGRSSTAAAAARRQALIQQANAQLAAGKQVLAAAEYQGANAQGKLNESLGKLQQASGDTKKSQEAENDLRKSLTEIEQEILHEQPADAPYPQAQVAIKAAKQELAAIQKQILARPEVAAKLQGLKGAELSKASHDALESRAEYTLANERVKAAGRELERIRGELFNKDDDWKQTNDALASVRHDLDVAQGQAILSGFSRLKPLQEYRKASDAAAAAHAAIAQAEGVLKQLKATPKSPSKSSASGKKK